MALTPEDVRALQAPFAFKEHEFLNGFVYLKEEAITPRLESVDLNWEFVPTDCHRDGNQAVVVANMTIKGVTRGNTGMQVVMTKSAKGKDNVERDVETGEADKGATTDALKRCARLFGVGRYLLTAPNNERDFAPWLADQQRQYGVTPTRPQQQLEQQQGAQSLFAMGDVHKGIGDLYPVDKHRDAVIEKGQREGWLINGKSTAEWVKAIRDRHDNKAAHWTADKVQADAFLSWALPYYQTKRETRDALQAAVQYPVTVLADWKGTVPEAQAAVLAAHCGYDRARIDAVTTAMHDLPESERAELALLARQVVERAKFNGLVEKNGAVQA